MKYINYTTIPDFAVLLCNIPAAKAYLQGILKAGLVPSKIIYIQWNNIKKKDSYLLKLYKRIPIKIQLCLFSTYFHILKNPIGFNLYEDVLFTLKKNKLDYIHVKAKTINDVAILDVVATLTEKCFLYTGGGLVRKPFFDTGKKLIHIHPGYLPFVRGSNGLLWSFLIRKKSAVSCFYMNENIDTGQIISRKEFNMPLLKNSWFLKFLPKIQISLLPIFLEYTFDPCLRASLLIEVLNIYLTSGQLPNENEVIEIGEEYHSMHPILCGLSINNCFHQ